MEKRTKRMLETILVGYFFLKTGGTLLIPSNIFDDGKRAQASANYFSPFMKTNEKSIPEIKSGPVPIQIPKPEPLKEKPPMYAVIREDPVEEIDNYHKIIAKYINRATK